MRHRLIERREVKMKSEDLLLFVRLSWSVVKYLFGLA